eukprot:g8234.t1
MGCCRSRTVEQQVILTKTTRTDSLDTRTTTQLVGIREFEKALHEQARTNTHYSIQLARDLVRNDTLQLSFTPHELRQLTRLFHAEMDDPKRETMSRATFARIVQIQHAGADANAMVAQLFKQFDDDDDGLLTLREFLQGFSYWKEHLWSNTDRLFFFFSLFDSNHSGYVDREEFTAMIRHIVAAQIYGCEEPATAAGAGPPGGGAGGAA